MESIKWGNKVKAGSSVNYLKHSRQLFRRYERIAHGGKNANIYALDCSSFFMLAVGVVGAGTVSYRLDSHASVPNHWFNDERTFCFPYFIDYAAWENSSRIENKMKL